VVQGLERLGDLDGGVGHAGVEERRGRLQEQNGLLGDWVAEFLGVGHVVAADADDLRARRKELLRRRSRSRHGRQSWWIGGVDEVEVTDKKMGSLNF